MIADHRLHYRFHSWCGIVLGVMLYLLCFSGTVAVYKDELVAWSNPPLQGDEESGRPAYDEIFGALAAGLPANDPPRRLTVPRGAYGAYELRSAGGARVLRDAKGVSIPERDIRLAEFFVNLHTRIFLGHEGRWVVGLAGFGFLASLLTGLLVHRRLLMSPLKPRASFRQHLIVWHKLAGVFGGPASLMLAVTGMWLGLYVLIIPAGGHLRSLYVDEEKPDGTRMTATASAPAPTGESHELLLNDLVAQTVARIPGFELVFIDLTPGKSHTPGTVSVRGDLPWSIIQRHRVGITFDASDGTIMSVHAPHQMRWYQRLHDAMMPLHVGDWGGPSIKLVYFLFGSVASWLCLSGLCAWADRRSRQAGWMGGPSYWPWHIMIGIAGTGSACIVLVPVLTKLGIVHEPESHFMQMWVATGIGYLVLASLWMPRPVPEASLSKHIVPTFRTLPWNTIALVTHALMVTAWGYAQYTAARSGHDSALQGLAACWLLTGFGCLIAGAVGLSYPRLGKALGLLSTSILATTATTTMVPLVPLLSLMVLFASRHDGLVQRKLES